MTRKGIEQVFELPRPRRKKRKQYLPTIKMGKNIPFGYEEDPEDANILLPIEDELDKLDRAKEFLKSYSYREVAYWLSEESGKYISPRGLKHRIDDEKRYRHLARIESIFAKRYKEKLEAARKLRFRLGGEDTYNVIDTEED